MKKIIGICMAVLLFAGCQGGQSAQSQPQSSSVPASSSASSGLNWENLPSDSSQSQSEAEQPKTFTLTIPEGYTLARIGMTLEELGVCTTDEFITAAQTGDYSAYPLVAAQAASDARCYKLEGYLFPDTYEFYMDVTPQQIITTMLSNTEKRIDAALREEIAASGYSVDEVLAIASIIEKESFGDDIKPLVSSVIHNRLNAGMKLQMDVTIVYVEGAIKPFNNDTDAYSSHYNTYKCAALPAGAICNPGLAAIRAALQPAATSYYYFVTDQNSNYLFAETYEEHQENCKTAGL